jgi:hypothetical protein
MWIDGQTDNRHGEANSRFSHVANASKNAYIFLASKEAGQDIKAEKRTVSSFPVDECSTESQPKDS